MVVIFSLCLLVVCMHAWLGGEKLRETFDLFGSCSSIEATIDERDEKESWRRTCIYTAVYGAAEVQVDVVPA